MYTVRLNLLEHFDLFSLVLYVCSFLELNRKYLLARKDVTLILDRRAVWQAT